MPITTSIPSNKCITVDEFNDLFEVFARDYDFSERTGNILDDFGLVTTPPTSFYTDVCIPQGADSSAIKSITKFVAYQYINGKLCYTLGFQRGSWYTINCCCIMGELAVDTLAFNTLLVDDFIRADRHINFRHMAIYHKTLGWFCQQGGSPIPLYIPCNNFFEAFGMAMENAEK